MVKVARDRKHGSMGPQKVAFWKGNPRLFQGNLGRWNIIMWPDLLIFAFFLEGGVNFCWSEWFLPCHEQTSMEILFIINLVGSDVFGNTVFLLMKRSGYRIQLLLTSGSILCLWVSSNLLLGGIKSCFYSCSFLLLRFILGPPRKELNQDLILWWFQSTFWKKYMPLSPGGNSISWHLQRFQ